MKAKTLIPNGFTLANLLLGFMSLIFINNEKYYAAALCVLSAMIFDALDGRVARYFGTSTEMGKELDSLCDLISFGIVPALLLYEMSLKKHGIFGLAAASLFPLCGAIRLARFNILKPLPYFVGLPITAAGGTLISLVLSSKNLDSPFYPAVVALLAYLMISPFKYPNFKNIRKPKTQKYLFICISAGLIIGMSQGPARVLFVFLSVYAFSGIIIYLFRLKDHKLAEKIMTFFRA
ncbi:MAG: CDP-diacylglycerol---serine O-phosphatidyltransferase [Thermosediminibacterales bacterium]|nr:CDP-diacylglycerol---serine O-phosphatidyltransferase [Thermosediminibacterales bacterium]MDK2836773.1 CDP-diacylglycerol---serine O-phosphatidyltransferase [Thermosediminibacterales bacterium]